MSNLHGTRAPLIDTIRRAQAAQQEHPQGYDVQTTLIPVGELPEPVWATENEVRDHFHGEIDHQWEDWIRAHYDHEG